MINPPDELLADLQSALPPEQQVPTPTPPSSSSGYQVNGHDHLDDHFYDRTSHSREGAYDRMSSPPDRTSAGSSSTVRFGIRLDGVGLVYS